MWDMCLYWRVLATCQPEREGDVLTDEEYGEADGHAMYLHPRNVRSSFCCPVVVE